MNVENSSRKGKEKECNSEERGDVRGTEIWKGKEKESNSEERGDVKGTEM